MLEGVRRSYGVTPKNDVAQNNTRDLVELNKYWRVVKWVKSLGETPMIDFTLALACVRKSVMTQVVGMSLISCMT